MRAATTGKGLPEFLSANGHGGAITTALGHQVRGLGSFPLSGARSVSQSEGSGFVPAGTTRRQQRGNGRFANGLAQPKE
jgi:hypothetical protein